MPCQYTQLWLIPPYVTADPDLEKLTTKNPHCLNLWNEKLPIPTTSTLTKILLPRIYSTVKRTKADKDESTGKTQRWHSRRILSSLWENLAVERWHIWYRPFRLCCCFWQCLPSESTFYSPHSEAAPAAIGSTGSTTSRSWSNKIVTQKLIIFECSYSAVLPLPLSHWIST